MFIHTEATVVGQAVGERKWLAMVAHLVPGHRIKQREPHADDQPRALRLNPAHDRAYDPRAAVQVAAEPPWPTSSRQKFVEQVAVAGLDVDHPKACGCGHPGRRHIGIDEPLNVVVGEHACGVGGVDSVAGVEQRVVVGDAGLTAGDRRLRKPARVSQLERDEQIVDRAEASLVGVVHLLVERRKPGDAAGRSEELVGVCATFGKHAHRLAAPDEFRAALAKPLPATQQRLGGLAIERGIPALHRVDAPAVAHREAADRDRGREW